MLVQSYRVSGAKPACKSCSQIRLQRPTSASRHPSLRPTRIHSSADGEVPWNFGFQMNERYLQWDDSASRQLVRQVVAEKMDLTLEEVDVKMGEVAALIPDLVSKLSCTRADVLVGMMQDVQGLAQKLLTLRELLPGVNVSGLVSRYPALLDYDMVQLRERLEVMRSQLPGVAVESVVEGEPMLLKADIPAVLANIRRILPHSDAVQVLVGQPQMVLDMTSAGMPSAVDVEGPPEVSTRASRVA